MTTHQRCEKYSVYIVLTNISISVKLLIAESLGDEASGHWNDFAYERTDFAVGPIESHSHGGVCTFIQVSDQSG